MKYEWGEAKRAGNLRKHGLDFADMPRFDWNGAFLLPDETVDGERRSREIGFLDGRLVFIVFIVYTNRGEVIRMISLRVTTRQERRLYGGDT